MKKLISLLCMAACLFSLAACAGQNDSRTLPETAEKRYYEVFENYIKGISLSDDDEVEEILANADGIYKPEAVSRIGVLYPAWKTNRDVTGDYVGVLETSCRVVDDTVVVSGKVDFSLRDANVKMTFDKDGEIIGTTIEPIYSFGEKMATAGMNTLIGIGVVFSVLILISLLISCFKYINIAETALKNKKENSTQVAAAGMDNTIAQIVKKEEEELVDDLELAAVISAAVAAYTGSSTDGFVVRSIKKSNKKRWQNA